MISAQLGKVIVGKSLSKYIQRGQVTEDARDQCFEGLSSQLFSDLERMVHPSEERANITSSITSLLPKSDNSC